MQVKITSVMGKGSPASCHCNYCIRIECSRADKLYHAKILSLHQEETLKWHTLVKKKQGENVRHDISKEIIILAP